MRKLGLAVAAAAVVGLFAGSAWAGTLSSSKVAISQGQLTALGAACAIAGTGPGACTTGGGGTALTDDTGFITVMTTFIRTPNNKELAFDVSLQCGLVTFTKALAKGTGGSGKDKASADGRIVIRVAVTPVDNDGLNPGTTLYAFPTNDSAVVLGFDDGSGDPTDPTDPDGVTYCFRFQELEVEFANLVCTETDECEIAVSLLLETLTAAAFNFVLPNVASGPKKIEVEARAIANAEVFANGFSGLGAARGEAFVGMGSMLVETVRAVQAFDEDTPVNASFNDLQ